MILNSSAFLSISTSSVQDNSISIGGAMCPKRIVTGVLEFIGGLGYWSEGPMPAEHRFYQCSQHTWATSIIYFGQEWYSYSWVPRLRCVAQGCIGARSKWNNSCNWIFLAILFRIVQIGFSPFFVAHCLVESIIRVTTLPRHLSRTAMACSHCFLQYQRFHPHQRSDVARGNSKDVHDIMFYRFVIERSHRGFCGQRGFEAHRIMNAG